MGLVTFIVWMVLGMAFIYGNIYVTTGIKTDDWSGLFVVVLAIVFLESFQWWALLLTLDKRMMFWFRLAATPISMAILYVFAEMRLSLDKTSHKLWIATTYPTAKLLLYLLIKGVPSGGI